MVTHIQVPITLVLHVLLLIVQSVTMVPQNVTNVGMDTEFGPTATIVLMNVKLVLPIVKNVKVQDKLVPLVWTVTS